ncbi:MAG: GPH family glycoside/pentoside/hexuronide:cation symporter [Halieaceae bacterium]
MSTPETNKARAFRPEYLAWGMGSLGSITMISAVSSIYLYFLVSVVKLSPALAGGLIFASKIVDMISDPLMGWISDRSNTRWGRRRPYMFFASFACAASIILIFSIPSNPGMLSTPAYVELSLIFYALALTAFNVPYLAMPAEMCSDYHERSTLMSYRAFFLVGGSFMGAAVAGQILKYYGGGPDAYFRAGCFLALVVFMSMMSSVLGTGKSAYTQYKRSSIPTANQLRLFLVNKPFLILGSVKAVQFLQLATSSAVSLFFFVGVLQKDEGLLLPFGLAVSAGSVGSIKVWLPITRAIGKRKTFLIATALQSLIYLSWLLATPTEPIWLFMLRAALMGACGCGVLVCSQSMVVDTIDYDRRLSGINREGVFSAVFSFIEKSTHAAGPLLVGILLGVFGFDQSLPRGAPQPESARDAIMLGMAVLPAACSLIMAAGIWFYDLSEEKLQTATVHELASEH